MGQAGCCATVMFLDACFDLPASSPPVLGTLQSFLRRQAVLQKVDELSDAAQQREREAGGMLEFAASRVVTRVA